MDSTIIKLIVYKKNRVFKNIVCFTEEPLNYCKSCNHNEFVATYTICSLIKQAQEENPHLVLGNVCLARKMGFPEVILPGDVRNDLYITILSGDFPKGSKTSDKNVEVTATVCDESGVQIPVSRTQICKCRKS